MLLGFLGLLFARIYFTLFGDRPPDAVLQASDDIKVYIENGPKVIRLIILVFLYLLLYHGMLWLWKTGKSLYLDIKNRGSLTSGHSNCKWTPSGKPDYGTIVAVGQAMKDIKWYMMANISQALHGINRYPLLYSGTSWLWRNGRRYLNTASRMFTSGHSTSTWTLSGNPDDIIAVGVALKDINLVMVDISRAIQDNNNWRSLKHTLEQSDWLWAQFTSIPYRAPPFIRKSVEAYRLILFDVHEAIHSNRTLSPNGIDDFNSRIDAILKEFKRDLAAMQYDHLRPPDNPSHCQSSHFFENSHHILITGGNFIQSTTDRLDRQLSAKILRMQYLTLGVLFG